MKIGVFDSGFGGLDIFRHIEKTLPEYDFIYLGDNARTPYGSRSQETIYQYVTEAVDFLFRKDCQLIIFACNTTSAKALRKIQQEYLPRTYPDRRVLGVIIPAVEDAIEKTHNNRIGIIGTESTIQSQAFVHELQKKNQQVLVFQQACPLLVPIVESDERDPTIRTLVITNYLKPLLAHNIDTLILGCTHYGILKDDIARVIQQQGCFVTIVSEGEVVAQKLKEYLLRHPESNQKLTKGATREFYTTDLTEKFQMIGTTLMGRSIVVHTVSLTD